MKTVITILCTLFVANTFAYTWVGDASRVCKKLAKEEVLSLLEYERNQQNGSQLNYIVRGPDADVKLTNGASDFIDVVVSVETYTLDDDGFEINEKYIFDAQYDRKSGKCFLGLEPDYEGAYCGQADEVKCLK